MRKAKNIIILPQFQFKLLSYFVILFVISAISLYSTVFYFFWKLADKAKKVGIPDNHVFFEFIGNLKYDMDVTFILFTIFNFILLVGVGLIISHRIAGPIKKLLNYLSEEPFPERDFVLRKRDFFKELEAVVTSLKNRLKK